MWATSVSTVTSSTSLKSALDSATPCSVFLVARAVRVAKKYGYAIAIGHPHKKTLQGVAESKALFNNVELVTIDTLVAHMKR